LTQSVLRIIICRKAILWIHKHVQQSVMKMLHNFKKSIFLLKTSVSGVN
jgi:hypothetical protein